MQQQDMQGNACKPQWQQFVIGHPQQYMTDTTVMHWQIRVLWQGRDVEWDEWDGGAFAKWMQACEDEEQQQTELAASLGVPAATAATLHRSSSQAIPGLRPQV